MIAATIFAIVTLLAPAAWAQQPAPAAPPDPQVVMAQAISDLQGRVATLEKEVPTIRRQATVDRSRFAAAIYRIAGESEPDALGRAFGTKPRDNAGHMLAAASDTAKRIGAQVPAPAVPEPAAKPAEPAPAPATQAAPGAPAPVRVTPAPAAPSDRDRKIADALERLTGELAGLARLLRQ